MKGTLVPDGHGGTKIHYSGAGFMTDFLNQGSLIDKMMRKSHFSNPTKHLNNHSVNPVEALSNNSAEPVNTPTPVPINSAESSINDPVNVAKTATTEKGIGHAVERDCMCVRTEDTWSKSSKRLQDFDIYVWIGRKPTGHLTIPRSYLSTSTSF